MADKPKPKPTITELRAVGTIPEEALERMEKIMVRLIQLQTDERTIRDEKGWTDPNTGERHRGLSDELEELYVIHNVPGLRIEDYIVILVDNTHTRIDAIKLSNLGVTGEVIKEATVTSYGTSLQVRRVKTRKKGESGAE